MPTIIENTQQVNALNEIEAALAIIKSVNTIISAGDGALAIVYKPEKGRKVQVDVPDASRAKAIGILSAIKDRLVKEVKVKATKFHIGLDEADLACMSDVPQSTPSEANEPVDGQGGAETIQEDNEHSGGENASGGLEGELGEDESLI